MPEPPPVTSAVLFSRLNISAVRWVAKLQAVNPLGIARNSFSLSDSVAPSVSCIVASTHCLSVADSVHTASLRPKPAGPIQSTR